MPPGEEHMFGEAAEKIHPLFVVFNQTSDRIKQGLAGAGLPFVVQSINFLTPESVEELVSEP
jgi:hypothetical protein